MITKAKAKKTIQKALFNEYGFKPVLKEISIEEIRDYMPDGITEEIIIDFSINHVEYELSTFEQEDTNGNLTGEYYTGKGSIFK